MTDSKPPRTPERQFQLIHVQHTETGFRAEQTTVTALAGWIQQEVDRYNAAAEPADGEVDAIENPLHYLLGDERTQMVRPAGRIELIGMLYAMSRNKTAGPAETGAAEADRLRQLAGELATTIRALHHVRENDHILFVVE